MRNTDAEARSQRRVALVLAAATRQQVTSRKYQEPKEPRGSVLNAKSEPRDKVNANKLTVAAVKVKPIKFMVWMREDTFEFEWCVG